MIRSLHTVLYFICIAQYHIKRFKGPQKHKNILLNIRLKNVIELN